MELFNEDFITFKHKGSSLCWRLMTQNTAKLAVQSKDEITVSLILATFKKHFIIFQSSPTWTIF